jgi:hypothetical protein
MAHILLYLALSFAAGVAATVLGFFGLTMVAGGAPVRPQNGSPHSKGATRRLAANRTFWPWSRAS